MAKPPRKKDPIIPLPLLADLPVGDIDGDSLGLEPFARTIAGAALGTAGPFTVGVYGSWGHGKTSLLGLAKNLLDSEDTNTTAPVATVWFNAWQHERTEHPLFPLIASIVDGIEDSLDRFEKRKDVRRLVPTGTRKKIREGWTQVGYSLRALARGMKFSAKGNIPLFGEVGIDFDAEKALKAEEILGKQDNPLAGELLYHHAFKTLKEQTEELRESLQKASGSLHANIVVFIDDLDRCNPERAVNLLEGIKLILSQPGFVFVLAVDREVIEGYLEHLYTEKYKLPANSRGQMYMDKLVQLPIQIPVHVARFAKHIEAIVTNYAKNHSHVDPSILRALTATQGALSVGANGNPRSFVRTMNAFLVDCQLWPLTQINEPGDPFADLNDDVAMALAINRTLARILGDGTLDSVIGDQALWTALRADKDMADLLREADVNRIDLEVGLTGASDFIHAREQSLRSTVWRTLCSHHHTLNLLRNDGRAYLAETSDRASLRERAHRFVSSQSLQAGVLELSPLIASVVRSSLNLPDDEPVSRQQLRALTNLDLSFKPLQEDDYRSIGHIDSLTNLALDYTKITDAGLEHLRGLSALTMLDLSGTQVTDAGLEHLRGLSTLTELYLSSTQVTDAGLEHLRSLSVLTTLALTSTQVTDAGLEHLRGLSALTELYLTSTQVTDAGLKHLRSLSVLTTLALTSTQVTDAGLEHLRGLSALTTLALASTKVTEAGVQEIEEVLPHLAVYR